MQRKIIASLAILSLIVGLSACPSQQTSDQNQAQTNTETQTETKTETKTETPASEQPAADTQADQSSTENNSTEKSETETAEKTEKSADADDTKVAAVMGNPENGKKVFQTKTCTACHTISSVEGAVGTIGPKLDGVATRAATRKPGMSAQAYIEESITTPDAYLVDGYQNMMTPGLRKTMSDQEFQDLVAFLMTLKS